MAEIDNEAFARSIEAATAQILLKLEQNVKSACLVIEREAKKNCPVDIGQLRADIHSKVSVTTDGIEGQVGNTLEYAPYVHNGTGIYAKDGNGRTTPWVYHVPNGKYAGTHRTVGQKPNPYLQTAGTTTKGQVERKLGGQ